MGWEKAQSIKLTSIGICLLKPGTKLSVAAPTYSPSTGEQRQEDLWGSLASQPHSVSEPQVSVRNPVSTKKVDSP